MRHPGQKSLLRLALIAERGEQPGQSRNPPLQRGRNGPPFAKGGWGDLAPQLNLWPSLMANVRLSKYLNRPLFQIVGHLPELVFKPEAGQVRPVHCL